MEVTPWGKIDGACKGKNVWDDWFKALTTQHVDVSIVHVKDQNLADMAQFRVWMDELFEYKNHELCQKGFEDVV